MKPRMNHSQIWKFFRVINKEQRRAECIVCSNIFSYKSTTANLQGHLRKRHKPVFNELCRLRQRQRSNSDFVPDIQEIRDSDSEMADKVESGEVIIKVDEDMGASFEYVEAVEGLSEARLEETDDTVKNNEDTESNANVTKDENEFYTEYDVLEDNEMKRDIRPRKRRHVHNINNPGWETNIDSFSTYVASILKMLPPQTAARFQVLIIQRLVKEQTKYL